MSKEETACFTISSKAVSEAGYSLEEINEAFQFAMKTCAYEGAVTINGKSLLTSTAPDGVGELDKLRSWAARAEGMVRECFNDILRSARLEERTTVSPWGEDYRYDPFAPKPVMPTQTESDAMETAELLECLKSLTDWRALNNFAVPATYERTELLDVLVRIGALSVLKLRGPEDDDDPLWDLVMSGELDRMMDKDD